MLGTFLWWSLNLRAVKAVGMTGECVFKSSIAAIVWVVWEP